MAKALLAAAAVVGAVCAADYAFVNVGGLTWAATPGASAIRAGAATAATAATYAAPATAEATALAATVSAMLAAGFKDGVRYFTMQ